MRRKMPAPVTKSLALAIVMQVAPPGFAADVQAVSEPAAGVTAETSPVQEGDFDWDWSGITANFG